MATREQMRIYEKRYRDSEKGKATRQRYDQSLTGRESHRLAIRKYKLGVDISVEEEAWALNLQGLKCPICQRKFDFSTSRRSSSPACDHDHISGKFRGFICFDCNIGLGRFGEDPSILARAKLYLEGAL